MVSATGLNTDSSRSHAVTTVTVEIRDETEGAMRVGKLSLVDLAGSEMVRKTLATGLNLEEAKIINKSLSALGNVIKALAGTSAKAAAAARRRSRRDTDAASVGRMSALSAADRLDDAASEASTAHRPASAASQRRGARSSITGSQRTQRAGSSTTTSGVRRSRAGSSTAVAGMTVSGWVDDDDDDVEVDVDAELGGSGGPLSTPRGRAASAGKAGAPRLPAAVGGGAGTHARPASRASVGSAGAASDSGRRGRRSGSTVGRRRGSISSIGSLASTIGTSAHSAIGPGGSGPRHVPYRDSKLTRLLQDSLGGNCRTALIICASDNARHGNETLSTLRFGARASRVQNHAVVNRMRTAEEMAAQLVKAEAAIDAQASLIQQLKAQLVRVTRLAAKLNEMRLAGAAQGSAGSEVALQEGSMISAGSPAQQSVLPLTLGPSVVPKLEGSGRIGSSGSESGPAKAPSGSTSPSTGLAVATVPPAQTVAPRDVGVGFGPVSPQQSRIGAEGAGAATVGDTTVAAAAAAGDRVDAAVISPSLSPVSDVSAIRSHHAHTHTHAHHQNGKGHGDRSGRDGAGHVNPSDAARGVLLELAEANRRVMELAGQLKDTRAELESTRDESRSLGEALTSKEEAAVALRARLDKTERGLRRSTKKMRRAMEEAAEAKSAVAAAAAGSGGEREVSRRARAEAERLAKALLRSAVRKAFEGLPGHVSSLQDARLAIETLAFEAAEAARDAEASREEAAQAKAGAEAAEAAASADRVALEADAVEARVGRAEAEVEAARARAALAAAAGWGDGGWGGGGGGGGGGLASCGQAGVSQPLALQAAGQMLAGGEGHPDHHPEASCEAPVPQAGSGTGWSLSGSARLTEPSPADVPAAADWLFAAFGESDAASDTALRAEEHHHRHQPVDIDGGDVDGTGTAAVSREGSATATARHDAGSSGRAGESAMTAAAAADADAATLATALSALRCAVLGPCMDLSSRWFAATAEARLAAATSRALAIANDTEYAGSAAADIAAVRRAGKHIRLARARVAASTLRAEDDDGAAAIQPDADSQAALTAAQMERDAVLTRLAGSAAEHPAVSASIASVLGPVVAEPGTALPWSALPAAGASTAVALQAAWSHRTGSVAHYSTGSIVTASGSGANTEETAELTSLLRDHAEALGTSALRISSLTAVNRQLARKFAVADSELSGMSGAIRARDRRIAALVAELRDAIGRASRAEEAASTARSGRGGISPYDGMSESDADTDASAATSRRGGLSSRSRATSASRERHVRFAGAAPSMRPTLAHDGHVIVPLAGGRTPRSGTDGGTGLSPQRTSDVAREASFLGRSRMWSGQVGDDEDEADRDADGGEAAEPAQAGGAGARGGGTSRPHAWYSSREPAGQTRARAGSPVDPGAMSDGSVMSDTDGAVWTGVIVRPGTGAPVAASGWIDEDSD